MRHEHPSLDLSISRSLDFSISRSIYPLACLRCRIKLSEREREFGLRERERECERVRETAREPAIEIDRT
jgi:hypothetical protein